MADQVKKAPKEYEVVDGLNYPNAKGKDVRREAGDVVSDIPKESVKWLLEGGHIKEVS